MNSTVRSCLSPYSDNAGFAFCQQFLLIFGVFCNSLLLYGLVKDPLKCFKNCSSYLIMNNAVSDLVLCLNKFARYHWRSCFNGLVAYRWSLLVTLQISFLSIFFLALDRCVIACYPFQYRVFVNGKKAVPIAVIIFQWTLSFLHVAVQVDQNKVVLVSFHVIGIFLLLCSCLLYFKTIHHLKKEAKNLKNHCEKNSTSSTQTKTQKRQDTLFKQKRFLDTIIYITYLLVFTISPVLIFGLVEAIHGNDNFVKGRLHMSFYFLFYFNVVINSFVYYFRLTNYKKTFKVLFCCKRRIMETVSF